MSDLKTRFRDTERIPTPDLWPEILNREPRPSGLELSQTRRVLVAAFALAIAVAGLVFAARTFEGRESPQPTVPQPTVAPAATNGIIAYGNVLLNAGTFQTVRPDGSDPGVIHVGLRGYIGVPSWSPDGSRIAFDVNSFDKPPHREGGNVDIYTANADGTDLTRLTFDKNAHSPAWSPNGREIAYVLGYGSVQQIGVMNADGSNTRQLTDTEGSNNSPSWSPDGTKIAFAFSPGSNSDIFGSNPDIYVMDADGSNVQRTTDDRAYEDQPAWSPDGRFIAFSRKGSGNPGIYTMAPDGTGMT